MNLDVLGPIAYRRFNLPAVCVTHEGHQHKYDHVTIIIRGRVKIIYSYEQDGRKVEGESKEFEAGETVLVKAGVFHTIKALEPNSQYLCVFSHRDFEGQVVQRYNGNAEAHD